MSKYFKSVFVIFLCIIYIFPFSCNVLASSENTLKEEVIYGNLDGNGEVQSVYVVNIFTLEEDGTIIDYGNYSSTKNMTSNDEIVRNGDEIKINTSKGKLYYEGTMEKNNLPWDINVKYFLDGKELSPKDIGGKSGNLEIKISIKKNGNVDEFFFKNYALQTIVKLNSGTCSNIDSDGATIANVGSDYQLTYTILPGNEKDIVIKTNVKDFKMDGIQFNGVSLNLDINIDGTSEITNKLSDLQNGISSISTGAGNLNDAVSTLEGGTDKLKSGAYELQQGIASLESQSQTLKDGSTAIKSGFNDINSALQNIGASTTSLDSLIQGSGEIKNAIGNIGKVASSLQGGIESYNASMGQSGIERLSLIGSNETAISSIKGQIAELQNKVSLIKSGNPNEDTSLYESEIQSLTNVISLLTTNNAVLTADETLINSLTLGIGDLSAGTASLEGEYANFDNAIGTLPQSIQGMTNSLLELKNAIEILAENYNLVDNGIVNYTNAFSQISSGYNTLYAGINEAANGASTLKNATTTLKSGTGELESKTLGMDGEVTSKISSITNEISNENFTPKSFVSDKNTNVKSLQFVIKTADITKEIKETSIETKEENPGFWQKFLNLFSRN